LARWRRQPDISHNSGRAGFVSYDYYDDDAAHDDPVRRCLTFWGVKNVSKNRAIIRGDDIEGINVPHRGPRRSRVVRHKNMVNDTLIACYPEGGIADSPDPGRALGSCSGDIMSFSLKAVHTFVQILTILSVGAMGLALFTAAPGQAQTVCDPVGTAADDGPNFFLPTGFYADDLTLCGASDRVFVNYDDPTTLTSPFDIIEIFLPDETPRPASDGNPVKVYGYGEPVVVSCAGATIGGNNSVVATLELAEGASCSLLVNATMSGDLISITGTLTRVDADDYTLSTMTAAGGGWGGAASVIDTTPPSVAVASTAGAPVSGPFDVTATFSEDVTGFELADFTVGNGGASNFQTVSARVYTATITPAADGQVTVDIAAATAIDGAGNDNTAATQFAIASDLTPPTASLVLPGASVGGPFTARALFTEDVVGFDVSDLTVSNGVASGFIAISAREFTALITPASFGNLTLSVAANAAQDGAGNASTAASETLSVDFAASNLALTLAANVDDATTVASPVTLDNPGSDAIGYSAAADVGWLVVTPATGTIPGSGSLGLNISLAPAARSLAAGTHNGVVTVTRIAPAGVVTTIPVVLTVAPRFGSLQIVATTPGGTHGDETFGYSSADPSLNGLSLTTSGGTAASSAFTLVQGAYDLTQNLPTGWELDGLTCVGDDDNGSVLDAATGRADIDLDANETIICTFSNSRDDDAVRLATRRAINNYLVRRGDRIISAAPDISNRLRARFEQSPGQFSADATQGEMRVTMSGSLAGMRNHAKANQVQMPGSTAPDDHAFDVWFAADFSSISDDRAGDGAESDFGIFQFGVDFAADERTVLGLMVQHDWMGETQRMIATAAGGISPARIDGSGWMAGPYAARKMDNGVIVDVLALVGRSDNDIDPLGLYTDSFETSRYLLRANVSGEWIDGPWRVRPSVSLSHFEETQKAYTDSLGVTIPEQSVSIGRLTAGPEIAYRTESPGGGYWEAHGQLNANFDYNPAGLMDATGRVFDTGEFRTDAAFGVRGRMDNGAVAGFEINFSGMGEDDFEASGARIEFRLPFGG
jgi:hypothetical protein